MARPSLVGSTEESTELRDLARRNARSRRRVLNRLTVVWVNRRGVPFDTSGFNAVLSRGTRIVEVARFDRNGVVQFRGIRTLTRVSYTLRLFDNRGRLFRTRFIPAGVEAFVVIG